jgi:hypothetical protein
MKTPQWLLRLLNKNYSPRHSLNEKELEILNRLDTHLTTLSATMPTDAVMVLKTAEISVFFSVKSAESIVAAVLKCVPDGFSYIPRSIAFFVDEQGSWCYMIAVRESGATLDPLVVKMYSQLLARTNDARSSK